MGNKKEGRDYRYRTPLQFYSNFQRGRSVSYTVQYRTLCESSCGVSRYCSFRSSIMEREMALRFRFSLPILSLEGTTFPICMPRARIFKRLKSPGIDSEESIAPSWEFVNKYGLNIYFNLGSDQDSTVYLRADFDLGFFGVQI
jgi:hypothetical protein